MLKEHPLDNTLIEYINAAAESGYYWEMGIRNDRVVHVSIHQGVNYFYGNDSQPNYAFHQALREAGYVFRQEGQNEPI